MVRGRLGTRYRRPAAKPAEPPIARLEVLALGRCGRHPRLEKFRMEPASGVGQFVCDGPLEVFRAWEEVVEHVQQAGSGGGPPRWIVYPDFPGSGARLVDAGAEQTRMLIVVRSHHRQFAIKIRQQDVLTERLIKKLRLFGRPGRTSGACFNLVAHDHIVVVPAGLDCCNPVKGVLGVEGRITWDWHRGRSYSLRRLTAGNGLDWGEWDGRGGLNYERTDTRREIASAEACHDQTEANRCSLEEPRTSVHSRPPSAYLRDTSIR